MVHRFIHPERVWEYAFIVCIALLAALMIGLAIRTDVLLSGDSIIWYGPAVQGLLDGEGYKAFAGDTFRGPFFPFTVYIAALVLGGNVFAAGLVVGVIAYLLFVSGVFLATRKAFGAQIALLVSIAVGLNATVLFNSVEWLTDMSFAALCIFALYFMFCHYKKSFWLGPALAGICAGLALTTRWNGAFLLFVGLVHPLVNPLQLSWRRRFLWLLGYFLGFLAAASPWFWINWQLNGSPLYNTSYVTGFHVSLVSPKIAPGTSLVGTILGDPVFFTVNYLRRLLWDGWLDVQQLIPTLLLLFAPAGLVVWLFSMNRQRLWYAAYFAIFWGIASLTHFEPRFYLILLPGVLICPLLFFLSDVVGDRPAWRNGPSLRLIAVILLLLGVGWYNYGAVSNKVSTIVADRLPQVQVAEWLAQAGSSEAITKVATRFFSGARYFIPAIAGKPVTTLASAAEYLTPPPSISHVFVEESLPEPYSGEIDPSMFDLLPANPRLEAVYYKPDAPRAVLYRVLQDNQVITNTTSSANSVADTAQGPEFAVDGNIVTAWMSELQVTSETTTTLTLDLGEVREFNRIWILPASAAAFPRSFNIQSSVDGQQWEIIAAVTDGPPILRRDPQVFEFDAVNAQFLRIAGVSLWPGTDGNYQMGFSEVRVSLGEEKYSVPYEFTNSEFTFDPQTGQLETCARNVGNASGAVQVALTIGRQEPILLDWEQTAPQQTVCFQVPLVLLVSPGEHLIQTEIVGPMRPNGIQQQKLQVDVPLPDPASAWQGKNLIPNHDLEREGEGWLIQAQVHFDQNAAHSGAKSLRVDKADFSGSSFYHVETPSVVLSPPIPYVFGGWIKTQNFKVSPALVSRTAQGLTWAFPRPATVSFDDYQYGSGTQDWTLWSGTMPAYTMAEQAAVSLFVTDFQNGSIWLDDVFILPLYSVTVEER